MSAESNPNSVTHNLRSFKDFEKNKPNSFQEVEFFCTAVIVDGKHSMLQIKSGMMVMKLLTNIIS